MSEIVVLAGEGEYTSDQTMKRYADDVAAALPDATLHYRTPDVLPDHPDFPPSSFGDLEVLRGADLLVVYTRFRVLPDAEMTEIAAFVERGGAVLGLRTSTHAFAFPDGSRWASWNDGFGRAVLGSPWVSHHGHSSSTAVTRVADDPLLAGVPERFTSRSWLYRVDLAPGCRVLLHGDPIDPEDAPTPSPVAWVREERGRVFFTSLGHPDDFALPAFRRLLGNATAWCLDRSTEG